MRRWSSYKEPAATARSPNFAKLLRESNSSRAHPQQKVKKAFERHRDQSVCRVADVCARTRTNVCKIDASLSTYGGQEGGAKEEEREREGEIRLVQ